MVGRDPLAQLQQQQDSHPQGDKEGGEEDKEMWGDDIFWPLFCVGGFILLYLVQLWPALDEEQIGLKASNRNILNSDFILLTVEQDNINI